MSEKIGKPAICYEFGLNESFLDGTKEELEKLAHNILELLSSPRESLDFHGIKAFSPKNQEGLTETMSEVVIDGILIIQNQEDRRKLINKIQTLNGDFPIDWERYDKRSPPNNSPN